jgi:hypothetical protein
LVGPIEAFAHVAIVSFVSHCSIDDPPKLVWTMPMGGGGAPVDISSSSDREIP